MTKPLLVVFLGFPGSGKTFFARRLAERLPAVTFNSDALRVAMFGSIENVERIRQNDQSRLYDDVFGAMNYVTRQVLKAGCSVVFDAQQMAYLVDRFAAVTDLPEASENVIEISGEAPFDEQYNVFTKALNEVRKIDA